MRRILVVAGLVAIALPTGAGAENVALPTTQTPLSSAPPLLSGTAQQISVPVFTGSLTSRERVTAHLDASGEARGVDVLQRIFVPRGDFFFSVPAPAADVSTARGSGSQPGLRQNAILWQGFSPGHRILASVARLRPRESVPHLPLTVSARTRVDGASLRPGERRTGRLDTAVRLANTTGVRSLAFTARAHPRELVSLLDEIRNLRAGNRSFAPFVSVGPPVRKRRVLVRAPLRVQGTIFVPLRRLENGRVTGGRITKTGKGVRIRVSRILADDRPPNLTVQLRGRADSAGPPKVDLTVRPVAPAHALRPPGSRSWQQAFASGRAPGARKLLALANSSLLTLARVGQYENFLTNPDPTGRTRTSYHYISGLPHVAVTPAPSAPTEKEGISPWAFVAFGIGAAAAILGLTVLWARS